MPGMKPGGLCCDVCHHRLVGHTPKCEMATCPCHYDPQADPKYYVQRRTIYEIISQSPQLKARRFDGWTDKAHLPHFVWVDVKATKRRPLTDAERKLLEKLRTEENNRANKMQKRIWDLFPPRAAENVPLPAGIEPAIYIQTQPAGPAQNQPKTRTKKPTLQTGKTRAKKVNPKRPTAKRPKNMRKIARRPKPRSYINKARRRGPAKHKRSNAGA